MLNGTPINGILPWFTFARLSCVCGRHMWGHTCVGAVTGIQSPRDCVMRICELLLRRRCCLATRFANSKAWRYSRTFPSHGIRVHTRERHTRSRSWRFHCAAVALPGPRDRSWKITLKAKNISKVTKVCTRESRTWHEKVRRRRTIRVNPHCRRTNQVPPPWNVWLTIRYATASKYGRAYNKTTEIFDIDFILLSKYNKYINLMLHYIKISYIIWFFEMLYI